jgi:hypothetical protein
VGRNVVQYASLSGGPPHRRVQFNLWLPYSLVTLMFAALPVTWFVLARRRRVLARRRACGQCVRCGYDLRATPGRCPECGTPATMRPGNPEIETNTLPPAAPSMTTESRVRAD